MGLVKECASDDEALLSFDKFVQDRMPELLRSAVGLTGFPYKYALIACIGHDFWTFDEISSDPEPSLIHAARALSRGFVVRAAILPSVFLVLTWMSNSIRPRTGWAEVAIKCGIAATAITVAAVLIVIEYVFAEVADESWLWLVMHALCSVALTVAVAKLFSWRATVPPPQELAIAARRSIREMSWGSGSGGSVPSLVSSAV